MRKIFLNEILKGSLTVLFLNLFTVFFTFILRLVYGNNLTVSQYGLLYATLGIVSLFTLFGSLGIPQGMVYFINKYKSISKKKELFMFSFFSQLVLSFLIIFLILSSYEIIGEKIFNNERISEMLVLFIPFIILEMILSVFYSYFAAIRKEKIYSLRDPLKFFLILIFGIYFLKINQLTLSNIILTWIISIFIVNLTFIFIFIKTQNQLLEKSTKITIKNKKNFLEYSFLILISSQIFAIITYTDIFMITSILGTYASGIYNVALPLSTLLLVFLSPIFSYFFPLFSKYYNDNKIDKIKKIFKLYYKYTFLIFFPIFVILIFFSEYLILILFNEHYLDANIPLKILLINIFIYMYSSLNLVFMDSTGNQRKKIQILTWILLINILLNYILIKKIGVIGAAISTVISQITLLLLIIKKSNKILNMQLTPNLNIAFVFFPTIIIIGFIKFFLSLFYLKLFFLIIFILIYYLSIGHFYLNKEEKKQIRTLIHTTIKRYIKTQRKE
jgi:O-antigen/teichoic acid export membrane protein